MTTHHLRPERRTLHGAFSPDLDPALMVDPGDTVVFHDTPDVSWGLSQHDRETMTRGKWGPRELPRDNGPAMLGPVHVRGALPGDTLVVQLDEFVPGNYGWTQAGDIGFNDALNRGVGLAESDQELLLWSVDAESMTAVSEHGFGVPLAPFFGTIGLCPEGDGWHVGWFPTRHGGNMDNPELVQGTTLFLPVAHPGGLLSCGDAHARQGEGELAGSAIEVRMKRAQMRLDVRRDFPTDTVTARTPTGWVTAGFSRDLDEALHQAVGAMLDLLEAMSGEPRIRCMALASAIVDVRVTQLVNDVRGIHVKLPHTLLAGADWRDI